jgi:hypothetical protein
MTLDGNASLETNISLFLLPNTQTRRTRPPLTDHKNVSSVLEIFHARLMSDIANNKKAFILIMALLAG